MSTVLVLLFPAMAAVVLGGAALSETLWSRSGTKPGGPIERAASVATTTLTLVLMVSWALALPGALTQAALLVASAAIGVIGAAWFIRRRIGEARLLVSGRVENVMTALAFAPLLLWIVFILYRGWVFAVASHDPLAYHLPRAALLARHHGYAFFDATTPTINAYPANFELLVADVIVLTGSDVLTEWVSTAAYIYLLVISGAIAERWWGPGRLQVTATVLMTALVPIALLHSGSHKNDLLMAGVVLATAFWGARWAVRGGTAPLLLAWASLATAIGTKISAAFLVVAVAPLLLWWVVTNRKTHTGVDRRRVVVLMAALAGVALLLGSAVYLWNLALLHSPFPVHADLGFDEGYGDWANLLHVPYLLFTRPFSHDDWGVWVPWRSERWFWPRYDLYFASLGAPITISLLLAPVTAWRFARQGDRETRSERLAATFVIVVMFLLTMPVRLRPIGFFGTFTRFVMYLPPILAAWTVGAVVADLTRRERMGRPIAWTLIGGLAILFGVEAHRCATRDSFAPLSAVAEVTAHPERDRMIAMRKERAAVFVDHVASPDDVVAFDGVVDAWIYPAFGRNLTRTVIPLHVKPGELVEIPANAGWVVIDRNWNMIWNHPEFRDMGQASRLLFRGRPKPIDLQLFEQLSADPRFRLVYRYAPLQQAVFQRVR